VRAQLDGGIERLDPWAALWRTWVWSAFLKAYLAPAADHDLLPADRSQLEALLEAYLLEEAVATLGYELARRPGWVRIPLHAILGILGA
jgi:maltose alpha-D-glucosyltransferase/alpha-amylase